MTNNEIATKYGIGPDAEVRSMTRFELKTAIRLFELPGIKIADETFSAKLAAFKVELAKRTRLGAATSLGDM